MWNSTNIFLHQSLRLNQTSMSASKCIHILAWSLQAQHCEGKQWHCTHCCGRELHQCHKSSEFQDGWIETPFEAHSPYSPKSPLRPSEPVHSLHHSKRSLPNHTTTHLLNTTNRVLKTPNIDKIEQKLRDCSVTLSYQLSNSSAHRAWQNCARSAPFGQSFRPESSVS